MILSLLFQCVLLNGVLLLTALLLPFDCNSTALRPFDDRYYRYLLVCVAVALKLAGQRPVLRHCDLNDL